jgi:hypothetical protein
MRSHARVLLSINLERGESLEMIGNACLGDEKEAASGVSTGEKGIRRGHKDSTKETSTVGINGAHICISASMRI